MMESNELSAEKIVKNNEQLKSSRTDFDSLYQTLHNYYFTESGNITSKKNKGSELHHLLDSTSLDCGDVLAAGLANYLTPDASRWCFLEHANPRLRDDHEVNKWMDDVTEELMYVLARSNFYNQMPIFYKASGIYGTAALFCEKDETDGVRFYNIPISKIFMTEDARERPNEFYIQFEYTAEQALSRFGDKCSQEIKDCYAAGRNEDKKFKFICYLGKRLSYDINKIDKANMPIRMAWVDAQSKQIMQEDGFRTMPCVAHRFYKRPQIVYGYSPAMKALPYVRLANTLTDTMLRAAMKQADPAIALPDDVFLGTPNFNPRAINYYQRGKLSTKDEVFPVGNYGNPQISIEVLQFYQNQIRSLMFYDTFQTFATLTKQMTVPEVMERISEKMVLLGPAVGRYMSDVLSPLIEKVITILYMDGRLPQVPEVMRNDPTFEVKFNSRLVQSQRQSEVNNITNAMAIAGQIAQFSPEVLDKLNSDKAIDEIFEINNVPAKLIRSDEEVEQTRQARAEAAAQQQQLLAAQSVAQTYKTATEGAKNEQTQPNE